MNNNKTGMIYYYLQLLRCPRIKVYWFYPWNMNSKITMDPSTANAKETTNIPWSPPWSYKMKGFQMKLVNWVEMKTKTSEIIKSNK